MMARTAAGVFWKLWIPGLVVLGAAGCAGLLAPGESSISREYEPPQAWESALLFQFMDSTFRLPDPSVPHPAAYGVRVEVFDGSRTRVVTGRDVFHADNGAVRTPWYRVQPPASGALGSTIRITVGDAAGGQTTAEYPLAMQRGAFYFIEMGVYTRAPNAGSDSPLMQGTRSYPVPAGARKAAGDSLWVAYRTRGRSCFNCPS